ncbi:hypothetical protein BCR33DRAFT_787612 [Rhizoclosmatium globosum]|uniref:Uncharacterized protein n=1 Tax=Rhizoclosmatium globosum TaxID=329046 RepID=A0A1Y2C0E3_9FUNG|nr:hypothetical protein BCR33DRAFT_787612 [Rhizoclosmatium globosum]|eukprot:ORY40513.1 hypothetical protein BCR33DRAFT_787612 [Rhizoclosmatium globosum]
MRILCVNFAALVFGQYAIFSSSTTVTNVQRVSAIVEAFTAPFAGVALIVAGSLAYRRRRQNKSTAAAAKKDLEQVKEDALLVAQ